MPSTAAFEKWWANSSPEYKDIVTRIANGSATEQAIWLDSIFGASCTRQYLNRVKTLTGQNLALSSNVPFQTTSIQRLVSPVLEPVTPLPKPTAPILEQATPTQQVFNLTATTQAISVPRTRSCASTTIEMLFNGPPFQFFQSVDLTGVRNPLLISSVQSMRARKYANTSLKMTSAYGNVETAFNQMRRMSHSQAIHTLCGDMDKFKIFIINLVQCTAPDCGKVMEETEALTGAGLTIGPGAGVVGITADFNTVQELLDHHILQVDDKCTCSFCKQPVAESKISRMDIPDTFLLHIDMRKVRYSTFLEVRLPSGMQKYQLECGLTTKHNPTSDEYSAFWKASADFYWHMGLDDQFSDIATAGSYAIKRTSEELPPYPTVLVYTIAKYIGTPLPVYRTSVAISPEATSSSQSPTKTTNHRKARKPKETQKVVEIEKKVRRNRKPAGGALIQKPPIRRSNRLQGKPAAKVKANKKEVEE